MINVVEKYYVEPGGLLINHESIFNSHPELQCIHSGSLNARYSPEYAPPLTATTMYCLPSTIYVIGDPLCCAGIKTAPTCSPLFLSYARSMAPRGRPGGAVI